VKCRNNEHQPFFKRLQLLASGCVCVSVLSVTAVGLAQHKSEKHYDERGRLIKPYGSTPSERAFIEKTMGFAIDERKRQRVELLDWLDEKWTGNNQPYRAITREVQDLLQQKRLNAALPSYQRAAQANPLDARLQYRYVLAGFSLEMQDWPIDRNKSLRWREDLACPDSPRTLDYARLRFLVEAAHYDNQRLKPLGVRLLQSVPRDNWTSFFVERLQKASTDPKDIQQNLNRAYLKLRSNSKDKKALFTVTQERMKIWAVSHKRSDAQAAIAAYKRYQQLLPSGSPDIARIDKRIRDINTSQDGFER
jgi:hypothetical protein